MRRSHRPKAGKPDLPFADRKTPCRVRLQLALQDGESYFFWPGASSYAVVADMAEAVDLFRTLERAMAEWWKERGGP